MVVPERPPALPRLSPREMVGRLNLCQHAVEHFGMERLKALAEEDAARERVARRRQAEYIQLAGAWRRMLEGAR